MCPSSYSLKTWASNLTLLVGRRGDKGIVSENSDWDRTVMDLIAQSFRRISLLFVAAAIFALRYVEMDVFVVVNERLEDRNDDDGPRQ
mmetsp:Transcript_12626/g.30578  ORF Transcript_12626/g.30578 Transcript_12626/m.30578 type:complete len:88 (-) Transcript_12626:17-280(-)